MLGATLGEWGREKYGLKPVKMDALEYLPEYLAHLRNQIKEEQAEARDTNAPCAFVTFRCRRHALECRPKIAVVAGDKALCLPPREGCISTATESEHCC